MIGSPDISKNSWNTLNSQMREQQSIKHGVTSGSTSSMFNNADSVIKALNSKLDEINSANKAAAANQNAFQEQSAAKTMQYNAAEAEKNRQFQMDMSSTAHQREVADLKAAGLNPILSANAGASTGSGASASTSAMSGAKADVSDSIINAISSIKQNEFNNNTQLKMNSQNIDNAYKIAKLQADTTKYAAEKGYAGSLANAGASQYAANMALQAAKYGADTNYAATQYNADTNWKNTQYSTDKGTEFGTLNTIADKAAQLSNNLFGLASSAKNVLKLGPHNPNSKSSGSGRGSSF